MRTTLTTAAALAAAILGCQRTGDTPERMAAASATETAAAKTVLDSLKVVYSRWIAGGQADSIASMFTPDGQQLPPNEPVAAGREAIRARQARLASWGPSTLQVRADELVVSGPLAVERGTLIITFTPGPNAPKGMTAFTDTAKYLVHFHNVDGHWLLADAAWSSNLPLPTRN